MPGMIENVCIGLRVILIDAALVTFCTSLYLSTQKAVGDVPTVLIFSIGVGVFGLIGSAAGLRLMYKEREDYRPLFVDLATSAAYLTIAIFMTKAMSGIVDCGATKGPSYDNRHINNITSGGCLTIDEKLVCNHTTNDDGTDVTIFRCRLAQTDFAFQYIGFVSAAAMILAGYLYIRSDPIAQLPALRNAPTIRRPSAPSPSGEEGAQGESAEAGPSRQREIEPQEQPPPVPDEEGIELQELRPRPRVEEEEPVAGPSTQRGIESWRQSVLADVEEEEIIELQELPRAGPSKGKSRVGPSTAGPSTAGPSTAGPSRVGQSSRAKESSRAGPSN
ncbi:hypothetical protein NPX13_g9776 [Xylaria arbuscula]|uniref:MARVEL domain-containing protein n=1 Tax=Xylaria arbuscula TaxID=114810 RepID=A0A9W8N631_9PEZI|nr:hypothetical protein NPX13_g9776 [Xylaria arbuscula]